jgi:hypothetical protein
MRIVASAGQIKKSVNGRNIEPHKKAFEAFQGRGTVIGSSVALVRALFLKQQV